MVLWVPPSLELVAIGQRQWMGRRDRWRFHLKLLGCRRARSMLHRAGLA
jgi:hypothetical protein